MLEDIEHVNRTAEKLLENKHWNFSTDGNKRLLVEMCQIMSSEIIEIKERLNAQNK